MPRPPLTPPSTRWSLLASAALVLGLAGCATDVHGTQAQDTPAQNTPAQDTPGVDDPNALSPAKQGRLIVDLVDGTSLAEAREITGLALSWVGPHSADEALAAVEVADLQAAQRRIEGLPQIEAVEPSLEFQALGLLSGDAFPNDPLYDRQWNFRTVDAPAGWRAGGGEGVIVAVIDTGLSPVADLAQTHVLEGVSFVTGTDSAADDNGHGTHVAGTIAQSTDNGIGVTGIAPRATILPLKALSGSGSGRSEWIASAIDEAVDQGARVINLSLGGPESRVIRVAAEKAVKHGVIVVAAAGNRGRKGVSSPANIPGVIGVSATGPGDTLAPYSSWGEGVDICAPGGDKQQRGGGILQDTIDSGPDGHAYKEFQGTSMATPHVAGAAAVLWGAGATSADAVKAALYAGAVDLGQPGPDLKYGQGRLDIGASLHGGPQQRTGLLFALGAVGAWLVARLGGLRPTRRAWTAALAGGLVAGGLFFLPLLPLGPGLATALLSRPLLLWPAALLGPKIGTLPLFISALIPVVLTLSLGPTRSFGALVAGLNAGLAAHLFYGAATGTLSVWLLPGSLGTIWLVLNGAAALLGAMATVGVQKMRARERA